MLILHNILYFNATEDKVKGKIPRRQLMTACNSTCLGQVTSGHVLLTPARKPHEISFDIRMTPKTESWKQTNKEKAWWSYV